MTSIKTIFFVSLLFNPIFADRYYRIKYLNCNVTDIATNYSCSVENNALSGHIFLTSIIDRRKEKRITIHIKGSKFVNKQWQTWLINGIIDVCTAVDFIFKPNSNAIVDILRPEIKRFTNVNHTCPFGPNELMYAKSVDGSRHLNSKNIYFLNGLYKLEGKAYLTEFNKLCVNVTVEVEIKNRLKNARKKG